MHWSDIDYKVYGNNNVFFTTGRKQVVVPLNFASLGLTNTSVTSAKLLQLNSGS